jgi:cell division protein FtsB
MKRSFQEDIAPFIYKLEKLLGLSFKVFLMTALLVMALGIYIANLLFGDNSLRVLEELKHERKVLTQEIKTLQQRNATLHKEYLEWQDAKE